MNRQDLINTIAKDLSLPKDQVHDVVVAVFENLSVALEHKTEVRIANFGTLDVKLRKGRVMNGPIGNGKQTPDKRVPIFRPAKALKERVDR